MVNFAELKAKAEKAKDVTVTKVTNTRDRYKSAPSSQITWDPNWKRGTPPPPAAASPRASTSTDGPPPPPSRTRSDVSGTGVPVAPRASRPSVDLPAPPPYAPLPPPTRATSAYPTSPRETSQDAMNGVGWTNLSAEDKEEFFGWLDEFFSRYLGIELSPREKRSASAPPSVPAMLPVQKLLNTRAPPTINMATRPPA